MGDQEEIELMQRVKRLAGPYLEVFAPNSSVPESWWAALTANESGEWLIHNTIIPAHFDQNIYSILLAVRDDDLARHSRWGSITSSMLAGMSDDDLRKYSSSYGLTQVEGYNVLVWPGVSIDDLNDPAKHYALAARLLAEDIQRFGLDPKNDFEPMFRCWNSGSPNGKTWDPDYAANGLARMALWSQISPPLGGLL